MCKRADLDAVLGRGHSGTCSRTGGKGMKMNQEKWNEIRLIVSDFDGVMTDNRVLVDEDGKESVLVSRADGQAVRMLRSMGIELVIMSSETSRVVERRAEKLRVRCIQGVTDKAECLGGNCVKLSAE